MEHIARTIAAGLLLALAGVVSAQECPEGAMCGWTAFYPSGGTTPPVEPPEPPIEPPVEPPEPPPGGVEARQRWEAQCALDDVIACRTWDSVEDVYLSSDMAGFEWTGVPNSPNRPLTNGKCAWVNPPGQQACFPAFGAELDEHGQPGAIASPDDFTCEDRVAREEQIGYSQDSVPQASLRSPCYYPEIPGAVVMTDWKDRGSSIQHIGLADWPDLPSVDVLYYEYEIAIGETFFRGQRKGSNTSKLARVEQTKDYCSDNRVIDERFLRILGDRVEIGYAYYCQIGGGRGYSPEAATLTIVPEQALRWFRISRELDTVADWIRTRVVDVETDETLVDYTHELDLIGPYVLKFARLLLHSSSHQPCSDDCDLYEDGHFAVRHVVYRSLVR